MATQEIFYQVLLAGVLGISGQLLRMVTGLVKLKQEATEQGMEFWTLFVPAKAIISILIGFLAGVLAWVIADKVMDGGFFKGDSENVKKAILSIIAAGYAGTDFIEGMMGKLLPKSPTSQMSKLEQRG